MTPSAGFLPCAGNDADPALIDPVAGTRWDYATLRAQIAQLRTALAAHDKQLVLLQAGHDVPSIAAYLGALAAGHAVLLVEEGVAPTALDELIRRYDPSWVIAPTPTDGAVALMDGLYGRRRAAAVAPILHPDLAVLLSTSGSTGSPKLVRLSARNLQTNTEAIITALGIDRHQRAAAHLSLAYSYGMSVVNTHLAAGGALVLLRGGMMDPAFWPLLRQEGCTSFAGVPYHYEMLMRLGLARLRAPTLRHFTQAGGRLNPELVQKMALAAQAQGAQFFVMYGQTEAAPRMTTLPAARVLDKLGAVGLPLAGGRITIEDDEVIYHGPNVMMGYAETRADLARGDDCGGRLATGDLGYLDPDGYLFITGRRKRIAKIYGVRVSLDEVEQILRPFLPVAAVEGDNQLLLFTSEEDETIRARARDALLARVSVTPQALVWRVVPALPLLSSGKVDFSALRGLA